MKERSPSMQFYFRQFAADEHVMGMDLDAIGAHILLMCAAGASDLGYKLPNKNEILRNISRCKDGRVWQRIKSQLLAGAWKLSDDGKWICQDGMRRTLLKQKEFAEKQRENAEKRWNGGNDAKPMPDTSQSDASGYAKGYAKRCSSSSSSSSTSKTLAPAVVVEVPDPQTAGASPSPSEVKKAIGKAAQQLQPRNGTSTGLRAHIEAGIYRKKIEAVYYDATYGGIAPAECILQAVHEGALSLMSNRSVELKGLTHGELAERAWAKIAASADTINSMKNFDTRSKQVVAVSVRCVVEAAMEFLAARKD